MQYNKISFRGHEGYIIDERVKKENKKEGYFYYDLRHSDDDWSEPVTIEDFVFVNHWGTICFKESIDHLLEPWGEGRLSTDLTEEEIQDVYKSISSTETIEI